MRLRSRLLWTLLLWSLGFPLYATQFSFSATLKGSNESPPNTSPATGNVIVTYNDVAHTMRVEAGFSGLLTNATAAHIHCCTTVAGSGNADVATTTPSFPNFPLDVQGGFYDRTLDMTAASSYNSAFIAAKGGTPASAEAALVAGMLDGEAYFDIHSENFTDGEIRGFLIRPSPPVLLGASSRKLHGGVPFSVPLPLTPSDPATEARASNGTATIVFTFSKTVIAGVASVTEGTATAGTPSFNGNELLVPLTDVANAQYVTVEVDHVTSLDGGQDGSGSARVGFLAGDVDGSRTVTISDLLSVNQQLTQEISDGNCLNDVNVSGAITLSDILLVNSWLTQVLPPP